MSTQNYKFTKEHEWINVEGVIGTVGISDYAQKELGDVVYVELPTVGDTLAKGDPCSNIESVKAVSAIYTPVSGEIVTVNEKLNDYPELVNKSPLQDGWIFKIKFDDENEMDDLMNQAQYAEYLQGILEE